MTDLPIAIAPVETPASGGRSAGLVTGLALFALIVAIAVFAPFITGHDPYAQDIGNTTVSPVWYAWFYGDPAASWAHPLGTDKLGRDYWTRLAYGAQISLLIGFSTIVISGIIGTALGVTAGYFRGWADQLISLLVSARLGIPIILIALALVSLFPTSLTSVILVLGLLLWDRFAVVIRSATLQARNADYVAAARAAGCSDLRIIVREILPNMYDELIVVAAIEMANAILIESSLSFLGLGVKPPLPSWGLMISDAKDQLFFSPWLIALPGFAIMALVLAINLIGNGLRHGLYSKH
jgi:peptide/nickel transport system permease protein